MFSRNANMLAEVGSHRLQEMLDRRDWSSLPVHAPYLKTVIQSPQSEDDERNDGSETMLSPAPEVASSGDERSSLLETVESAINQDAKDESDYLRLADEIERWLREG